MIINTSNTKIINRFIGKKIFIQTSSSRQEAKLVSYQDELEPIALLLSNDPKLNGYRPHGFNTEGYKYSYYLYTLNFLPEYACARLSFEIDKEIFVPYSKIENDFGTISVSKEELVDFYGKDKIFETLL